MSVYPSGNPARMGRRVWARVIDLTLALGISGGGQIAAASALLAGSSGLAVAITVVMLAWAGFSFWAVFARAALPGQLMLGLHHVDAETGKRAGGKTFLKYLLQGFTFGFAFLITPLTIQQPNRSCFDRAVGVTLVDAKEPDPSGHEQSHVSPPPSGWAVEESNLTQVGYSTPGVETPPAPPVSPGPMIQSLPFETPRAQVPTTRSAAPQMTPQMTPPVAPPIVPPVPAREALVAVATLDSGERVPVRGTVIVGRAPRQSAGLDHATLVSLGDPSLSANHLALGLDDGGPWVMDLKSTNGSSLEQGGGGPVPLEPMVRSPLSPGAVVRFGQRSFTVGAP